jgi:hypothetical protein
VVHEQRTTELDKAFVYTYYGCMGKLPNTLKSSFHLTPKQKKFAEVMVAKWGQITKAEAVREAGYEPKRDNGASELGSKLTNPTKNPHVVRYIEKLRAAETFKWEKDKLRSYKQFDRMREGAIEKNQFNAAINAEKSIGQMAGFFVNKSEVNVIGLEGMSREQLEKRLDELERKIGEGKNIIDAEAEVVEAVEQS